MLPYKLHALLITLCIVLSSVATPSPMNDGHKPLRLKSGAKKSAKSKSSRPSTARAPRAAPQAGDLEVIEPATSRHRDLSTWESRHAPNDRTTLATQGAGLFEEDWSSWQGNHTNILPSSMPDYSRHLDYSEVYRPYPPAYEGHTSQLNELTSYPINYSEQAYTTRGLPVGSFQPMAYPAQTLTIGVVDQPYPNYTESSSRPSSLPQYDSFISNRGDSTSLSFKDNRSANESGYVYGTQSSVGGSESVGLPTGMLFLHDTHENQNSHISQGNDAQQEHIGYFNYPDTSFSEATGDAPSYDDQYFPEVDPQEITEPLTADEVESLAYELSTTTSTRPTYLQQIAAIINIEGKHPIPTAREHRLRIDPIGFLPDHVSNVYPRLSPSNKVILLDRLSSIRPFDKTIPYHLEQRFGAKIARKALSRDTTTWQAAALQILPDVLSKSRVVSWMNGLKNWERIEVIRRLSDVTFQRPDSLRSHFLSLKPSRGRTIADEILAARYIEDIWEIVHKHDLLLPPVEDTQDNISKKRLFRPWQLGLSAFQRVTLRQRMMDRWGIEHVGDSTCHNRLVNPKVKKGNGLMLLKANEEEFKQIMDGLRASNKEPLPFAEELAFMRSFCEM
jgi:hypothetical protein